MILTPLPPFDRGHVLVVDDNSDMRAYLSSLLAPFVTVECVCYGEAGLQSALQRVPWLVVSDVMMPRLDGFGLLSALRGHALTRSVPVILVSARAGEESRVDGLRAGADDYLVKLFSGKELVVRVQTQLELSRLRRGLEREVAARTHELQQAHEGLREAHASLQAAHERLRAEMAERVSVELELGTAHARARLMEGSTDGGDEAEAGDICSHAVPRGAEPAERSAWYGGTDARQAAGGSGVCMSTG